jgi:hypothetical protein
VGPAKFCPNCGKSLWNPPESNPIEQKDVSLLGQPAIYSLGVKLEQMVEEIMKNKGFSTERRKKLRGQSSAQHEIDVLATRGNVVLAVECKNYGEARVVCKKEITDFQGKLQDLPQINHALFVTNIRFTSGAEEYANHNHIELWDGEKLRSDFYLLNLGRLGSGQGELIDEVLDYALPVVTQYNEATKLLLVNPEAISADTETTLSLHPYYVFIYQVEVKKGLFSRQKILEDGSYIVDATTRKIIKRSENYAKYKGYADSFFSKGETQNQEELEEILEEMEKNQIIDDLIHIGRSSQYKIKYSSEYAINKLECKLPANAAERMVLEEITREKKVQDDNVIIKTTSLIYVPKWLVNFKSKELGYRREVLPASQTVITDEIAFCPKELYEDRRHSKKKTYAVCEVCGRAYCGKHISPINNSYYCEKHTSQWIAKGTTARPRQLAKNIESSLSNIKDSLNYSIDEALQKHLR